jgi:hypothetical protein
MEDIKMGALLGILGPLLPYLLLGLGVLGAYFGIKSKGKSEAKAEFQKQQQVAQQKVQAQVQVAVGKDQEIDKKVEAKLDEIKNAEVIPSPSDPTKFKF